MNLADSAVCECEPGFVRELGVCVDDDECRENNGGCGDPARVGCINRVGEAPTCKDIEVPKSPNDEVCSWETISRADALPITTGSLTVPLDHPMRTKGGTATLVRIWAALALYSWDTLSRAQQRTHAPSSGPAQPRPNHCSPAS